MNKNILKSIIKEAFNELNTSNYRNTQNLGPYFSGDVTNIYSDDMNFNRLCNHYAMDFCVTECIADIVYSVHFDKMNKTQIQVLNNQGYVVENVKPVVLVIK